MVLERAQVALRVRVEARVEQLRDDLPLRVQRARGHVHEMVEAAVEVGLVHRLVGDARHVDGHDADRTRGLAASEEPAGLLAQFAQVEAQAAAHGAHVGGLHIRVDVVGEVGRAVLGGHLEQQAVVLRLAPIEVVRDGVRGDGVLEAAAVRVALDHDLDERLVHHVHLGLAVAVGEALLAPAHDGWLVAQVGRAHPVERDVAERSLRAPARRRVHAEHERLHALLRFVVREVIRLHERREVGVEARERLRAGPLVLHDAEEVHHLVAQAGQVAGRLRRDLAGHAAQSLLDELLERPACAVAREHGQVVQVDVGAAVRARHLVVVDLGEPVVGRDGAGVGQDEAAHGVRDRGVLLHAPVLNLDVLVHEVLVVQQRRVGVAHLLALLAVQDVGLRHVGVPGGGEHLLHAVLHVLDADDAVFDLRLEMGGHVEGQKVDGRRMVLLAQGVERLGDGA